MVIETHLHVVKTILVGYVSSPLKDFLYLGDVFGDMENSFQKNLSLVW